MEMLRKKHVFFGTSVTVTNQNIAQVTDAPFVSFLQKSGCGLAFYVEYVPADGKSDALAPTDADRAFLDKRLEALREEKRMLAIAFPGDEKILGGCLAAGRGFFHINPNGDAEPCPFSPYFGHEPAGMHAARGAAVAAFQEAPKQRDTKHPA